MNKLKKWYIKYVKLPDLQSEIKMVQFYHPKAHRLPELLVERSKLMTKLNSETKGEAIL